MSDSSPGRPRAAPSEGAAEGPADDRWSREEVQLWNLREAVLKEYYSVEGFLKKVFPRDSDMTEEQWEKCFDPDTFAGVAPTSAELFHIIQRGQKRVLEPTDIRAALARVAPRKDLSRIRTIFLMLPWEPEGALTPQSFRELCAVLDISPQDADRCFGALGSAKWRDLLDLLQAVPPGLDAVPYGCAEATLRLQHHYARAGHGIPEDKDLTAEKLQAILPSATLENCKALIREWTEGAAEAFPSGIVLKKWWWRRVYPSLARPTPLPGTLIKNVMRFAMRTAGDLVIIDSAMYFTGDTIFLVAVEFESGRDCLCLLVFRPWRPLYSSMGSLPGRRVWVPWSQSAEPWVAEGGGGSGKGCLIPLMTLSMGIAPQWAGLPGPLPVPVLPSPGSGPAVSPGGPGAMVVMALQQTVMTSAE